MTNPISDLWKIIRHISLMAGQSAKIRGSHLDSFIQQCGTVQILCVKTASKIMELIDDDHETSLDSSSLSFDGFVIDHKS